MSATPLLEVRNLTKHFPIRTGLLQRVTGAVKAVDGVSFDVHAGETLALVGESGCGKTTTGRSILRLVEPTSGTVRFDGTDVLALRGETLRRMRRRMQIIFQDPYGSLNPRMTVGAAIKEGLIVHGLAEGSAADRRVSTLLDEVGLDIAGKSGPIMAAAFGERMRPSVTLQRVIESGRLGRKAKRGFYRYDEQGKRQGVDQGVYALTPASGSRLTVAAEEIQRRTVLPMLNEAVRCLEDGIIRSPRDGDIGAVFGIGFPPFRGGPFRFLDALGAATVVRQLEELDARFPGRYEPAALLRAQAASGARFHP